MNTYQIVLKSGAPHPTWEEVAAQNMKIDNQVVVFYDEEQYVIAAYRLGEGEVVVQIV